MFKKIAILAAMAFSLAASAGAMSPSQQYPLPPPDGGGGNIVASASAMSRSQQYPLPPPDGGGGNIVLR